MIIDNSYYIPNDKIYSILLEIRTKLNNNKLRIIENKGDKIRVTCPFHKNGKEEHASCGILLSEDKVLFNCFSCGKKGDFISFVAGCFDWTYNQSKQYLIETFSIKKGANSYKINDPIGANKPKHEYVLDELLLENYDHYCNYFQQRRLSRSICEKFKLRYDQSTNSILIPVWSKSGKYIGNIKRNINNHYYTIDLPYKPIYLLDFIIKNKIKSTFITEGQIDALTLYEYGKTGIATLGQPNLQQIEDINKSGIRVLIAAFDNDNAGKKMTTFLYDHLSRDILYQVLVLPKNKKDINECTKEELEKCLILDYNDWMTLYKNLT